MKLIELLNEIKTIQSPKLYHGTQTDTFPTSIKTDTKWGIGLFTTTIPETAAVFGKHIFELKLKIVKPFIVDAKDESYDNIETPPAMRKDTTLKTVDTDMIVSYAYKNKYDTVVIKNVFEGSGNTKISDVYVTFSTSNVISPKLYGKSYFMSMAGVKFPRIMKVNDPDYDIV